MKILIVEDEFALADALRDRLMQEKYEVDIANDGTTGYDMCMTGAYDIIIMDGMLPGKDGIEIICELDQIHSTAGSALHSFLGIVSREAFEKMAPTRSFVNWKRSMMV